MDERNHLRSARCPPELWFWLGSALIMLAGFALRCMAAGGELTQDEITSVNKVADIRHWWEIFWTINGDNTHYLTSLYLYFAGPAASVFVRRLPSILIGTVTIAAAGVWGFSCGRIVALCTMALVAFSFIMVEYGSLARGYSGLGLCTILLLIETEHALDHSLRPRMRLALYVVLGFLSHLFMAFAAGGAALWVLWERWLKTRRFDPALADVFKVFWKAGVATLPLLGLTIYLAETHRYLIGENIFFSSNAMIFALNLGFEMCADLPIQALGNCMFYLVLGLVTIQWLARRNQARSRLYFVMAAAIPLLVLSCHMRNLSVTRYFFPSLTVYLLMLGDLFGRGLAGGRIAWLPCGCLLLAIFWCEGVYIGNLYRYGRGDYVAALQNMTQAGPASFGTSNTSVVKIPLYAISKYGFEATYVPFDDWCANPPGWFIQTSSYLDHPRPKEQIVAGPSTCPGHFRLISYYRFFSLSGIQYDLYRRE